MSEANTYNQLEVVIQKYNNAMEYFRKHPETPTGKMIEVKEGLLNEILAIAAVYIFKG